MARLRIVQPGFTTYTGLLHTVKFTNGVSDADVPAVQAAQLAASFMVEDSTVSGVQFGEVSGLLPLTRGAAQPNRVTTNTVTDLKASVTQLRTDVDANTAAIAANAEAIADIQEALEP